MPPWERAKEVVNRELSSPNGVELTIRLFTPPGASLADALPEDPDLERLDPGVSDFSQVPLVVSRHLLEQAEGYDLVGYMEDDLLLSDPNFSPKSSIWIATAMAVMPFYPTAASTSLAEVT